MTSRPSHTAMRGSFEAIIDIDQSIVIRKRKPPTMASIFGPSTVQVVMAGQAAVGVVVNLVQLVSEVISLYTSHEQSIQNRKTPEETSALISRHAFCVWQLVDTQLADSDLRARC